MARAAQALRCPALRRCLRRLLASAAAAHWAADPQRHLARHRPAAPATNWRVIRILIDGIYNYSNLPVHMWYGTLNVWLNIDDTDTFIVHAGPVSTHTRTLPVQRRAPFGGQPPAPPRRACRASAAARPCAALRSAVEVNKGQRQD